MKSRCLYTLVLAIAAGLLAPDAWAQARTPWEMNRGEGVINLDFTVTVHGEARLYDYATIPAADDNRWGSAPLDAAGNISFVERSILSHCWIQADFTYFQTLVNFPANATVDELKVSFSQVDDGARVYIFNSEYPGGTFLPGADLRSGLKVTVDLSSLAQTGETNRIVIVQVDDCPTGNNLQNAQIVVNGTIIEEDPDTDGDGVNDDADNCPAVPNPDQADHDGDGTGDVCDADRDGDGVNNDADAFPDDATETTDTDGDGTGDNADLDDDNDGQSDVDETACGSDPLDAGNTAPDFDGDHSPDCVDLDDDNDGLSDEDEAAAGTDPFDADSDDDGMADGADPYPLDGDNDGVNDTADVCPATSLPEGIAAGSLKPNRFALVNGDFLFDTVVTGKGKGPGASFTTTDTGGCSCSQIIERQGLGSGHAKHGCSLGEMREWAALVQSGNTAAASKNGSSAAHGAGMPTEFALEGNYPNPFNPQTSIRFALPEAATVSLAVYDAMGREVRVLVQGTLEAGRHEATFDASSLPSGVYLYRLEAGAHSFTRTMMLLK